MPDTIERFLKVDEIMKDLVLKFKVLYHQQPQVEQLFSSTYL